MGVPDDAAGRAAAEKGRLPGTAGALRTELESLLGFQKRVDKLLDELDESDAEPKRLGEDRIAAGSLGAGFAEATGLYSVYQQVHDQLTTLSTLLSSQVSALSTAVGGVHKGYKGVDDDVRARMWAIQADLQKHYDPKRDPYAKDNKEHAGGHGGHDGQGGHGGGHHEQKKPGDGGSI